MSATGLGDIIKPVAISRQFASFMRDKLVLVTSGAATADFDALAQTGGDTVTIKKFGVDRVASERNDGSTSTPGKISTVADVGVVLHRKRVRGVDDVVKSALGTNDADSVNTEIARTQADYWSLDTQAVVVAELKGLFDDTAGVLKDTHRVVDTNPASFGGFVGAKAKLGDNMNDLSILVAHSLAYASLEAEVGGKANYIAITGPDGKIEPQPYYNGRRVLLSDSFGKVTISGTDYYPIYLLRQGAIALGYQRLMKLHYMDDAKIPSEVLTSTLDYFANVRGTKWVGAVPAGGPTNVELADPASWAVSDVAQPKDIGVIQYLAPLAA